MSAPSFGGASRDGYGKGLLRLADDPRVVVLDADLGKSTKSCHFRTQNPTRTISIGVAEQNMMLVAAGMASSGKIPFASTFAIFTERAFEQIRNGIARPELTVHICGSHGGIHTGTDGSSAQSIEDIAIYRTLPGMTVLHPCDDLSAEELTVQLVNHSGPSYMRTARNKTPRIYNEVNVSNLAIGKGSVIREGTDVCILACGVMVSESLSAADELAESGISVSVVDMHTLKPLDCALVDRLASECGCIVTAEDHSVIGGLGGAVAEHLSVGQAVPLEMVGVRDRFGESGSPSELMSEFGLTSTDIQNAARRAMERK
ncbi:MAG: transketolase [Candidatus Thalassarchaeum betae]|uniref:Transketolase n=1 Tax=Candidatus Thalassarchaeum betae TaxID=2599289 RepID=A0A2V3HS41_9ARCH|nr:MAG: transketolase [Candidatus Thalassoarchaea betae]PXF26859.1 MAG: transketolase [Euryarchaeota archaeon]HIC51001.1 transketolase family protein [Candidatus Poseidoniales archaeon]